MNNIKTIAFYTFKNIIRSKILIGVAILSAIQFALAFITSQLTYGIPIKVTLDFGLGMLTLSSVAIAIFMGSTLIWKEVENRTVYITLSRGIGRTEFILGKMLGLILVIFLNNLVLVGVTLLSLIFFNGHVDHFTYVIVFFICLESMLSLLVTLIFSLFMNPILTVICSLSTYICAYGLSDILKFHSIRENPVLYPVLKFFSLILPNLDIINYRDFSMAQLLPSPEVLCKSLSYILLYMLGLILILCLSFKTKELD